MFERYTERAQQALFLTRHEISETTGGLSIEPEHLLLGLLRVDDRALVHLFETYGTSVEALREETLGRVAWGEKVSTSVEIPFGEETVQVLKSVQEEADRLRHTRIGPSHLLLGLLRVEGSLPASILRAHGIELGAARERTVEEEAGP